jgi:hypothetical protein
MKQIILNAPESRQALETGRVSVCRETSVNPFGEPGTLFSAPPLQVFYHDTAEFVRCAEPCTLLLRAVRAEQLEGGVSLWVGEMERVDA